jgi:uncharacterized protein YjbJ (UPF0337 family)
MDKNRVAGSIKEVKGAAKEAIGKALGDAKLQSDGEADKAVGKLQNYAGSLNDAVRDAEVMKSAGLLVANPINGTPGHQRHSPHHVIGYSPGRRLLRAQQSWRYSPAGPAPSIRSAGLWRRAVPALSRMVSA